MFCFDITSPIKIVPLDRLTDFKNLYFVLLKFVIDTAHLTMLFHKNCRKFKVPQLCNHKSESLVFTGMFEKYLET